MNNNSNAEVNGYSIYPRLHLSILKTLLAHFDEEVFCFATVLSLNLIRAVLEIQGKQISTLLSLPQPNTSVSCVISRWQACPSFPLQAFVLCMHVCNYLIVLWPPMNWHFAPIDRIQKHPSHPQRKPLENRQHAFFPPNPF